MIAETTIAAIGAVGTTLVSAILIYGIKSVVPVVRSVAHIDTRTTNIDVRLGRLEDRLAIVDSLSVRLARVEERVDAQLRTSAQGRGE